MRITLEWLMSIGTPSGSGGHKRSWNSEQKAIFAKILHHGCAKGLTRDIVGKEISAADAQRGADANTKKDPGAEWY